MEVGGEVQLKWEKELELKRDTIGVGEKWVKYARGVGGGWVPQISSDRDDFRILGGLKFLISGFLGVGKFGKYFLG